MVMIIKKLQILVGEDKDHKERETIQEVCLYDFQRTD